MRTGSRTLFVWLDSSPPGAVHGAECAPLSTERFPAKRLAAPGRGAAGRGLCECAADRGGVCGPWLSRQRAERVNEGRNEQTLHPGPAARHLRLLRSGPACSRTGGLPRVSQSRAGS